MSFVAAMEQRFLRYVQIDTQADEASPSIPSTAKQYDLLNLLVQELKELGVKDVTLTSYANVIARFPATKTGIPSVAFLAHVDTALEVSGASVVPIVHRNYDGGPIVLPDDPSQVIDPTRFPYLAAKKGDDLVTASGTTLLGADDKSGVAILMTIAELLQNQAGEPRGEVVLCFTCDEEIGRGVHKALPKELAVDYAYTLDGGKAGSVDFETFSADCADIRIEGVSLHPGYSYGQAVNAMHLASRLLQSLPFEELTPATARDDQGFLHPYRMEGNPAEVTLGILLRDFEQDGLAQKGALLEEKISELKDFEPRAKIEMVISPQYRNMRYWLENDMRPVELALEAVNQTGVAAFSEKTRGGTDGSRLTEMGVPTPNLFTGQQNLHGPLEWISLQDMEKATLACMNIISLSAQQMA